jgi:hypothetical protein
MINAILQPGKTLLSPADHMPVLIGQSEVCLDPAEYTSRLTELPPHASPTTKTSNPLASAESGNRPRVFARHDSSDLKGRAIQRQDIGMDQSVNSCGALHPGINQ